MHDLIKLHYTCQARVAGAIGLGGPAAGCIEVPDDADEVARRLAVCRDVRRRGGEVMPGPIHFYNTLEEMCQYFG